MAPPPRIYDEKQVMIYSLVMTSARCLNHWHATLYVTTGISYLVLCCQEGVECSSIHHQLVKVLQTGIRITVIQLITSAVIHDSDATDLECWGFGIPIDNNIQCHQRRHWKVEPIRVVVGNNETSIHWSMTSRFYTFNSGVLARLMTQVQAGSVN